LLKTYEQERKTIAESVIHTSGLLVRSTKYSESGTHAQDYVKLVQKFAGNITGMGIRYGQEGLEGTRLHDFEITIGRDKKRIYSLLKYNEFSLLIFDQPEIHLNIPTFINIIHLNSSESSPYKNQILLVRPDSYIMSLF